MTLYTPEKIARDLLALYETDYATSLATVEAAWTTIEHIPLDDFKTREIVANPEMMPKVWESPALQIGTGTMRDSVGDEGQWQQFYNRYEIDLFAYYYIKHPDRKKLAFIIDRHIQATLDFLNSHPNLDYGQGNVVVPGTLTLTPSEVGSWQNLLVQGLRMGLRFKVTNYGA